MAVLDRVNSATEYEVNFRKDSRVIEAVWKVGDKYIDDMGNEMQEVFVLSAMHLQSAKKLSASLQNEKRGRGRGFQIREFVPLDGIRIGGAVCTRYSEKRLREFFAEMLELVKEGM